MWICRGGAMVINATFNNSSVILWWSVLLVDNQRCLDKTTDLLQVTDNFITKCYIEYTSSERDSNSQL
jgi:hypothetical protein